MLGRKIIHLEHVDSTNNYAANLLAGGKIEHGTVILAEEQSQGKGQRGASWVSKPSENLILSLYLDTANLSVKDQFSITQCVSLALVATLSKFAVLSHIKWPNDIYVGTEKIAGILIENQLKGSFLNGSIVGIGLNLNQIEFGDLNATSVRNLTGNFTVINEFLFCLLNELNHSWNQLEEMKFEELKRKYLGNLWRFETWATFLDSEGQFKGKIIDTEDSGRLVVQKQNELASYDLKEISFIF